MIRPRNTFVVVKLIEEKEKQVGKLVIPTAGEQYCEAEVIAVGPGTIAAEGGVSETHDLKPGQRVLVRHKEPKAAASGYNMEVIGIPYRYNDELYHVFQEGRILGIIADPMPSDMKQILQSALH